MKILVMGLPGSGKTTLATQLAKRLNAVHLNADEIRDLFGDHNFSRAGRFTQARRMRDLAEIVTRSGNIAVADFVCPLEETRSIFNADLTIWVDRIKEGRFEDTNQLFEEPSKYGLKIKEDYDIEQVVYQVSALVRRSDGRKGETK